MIELQNVTKFFASAQVVNQVSLQVAQGELLVLLGASGCGKTTTLKMINRLIEPSAGRILLDGVDVQAYLPHELRRRIGYVFQRIGLFPHLNVAENIGITLTLLGQPQKQIAARVEELLALVHLESALLKRRPMELSGGQQQRVAVARALAASPRVMLLDEPFAALDPLTRERLQQALLAIKQKLSLTAIFVTHDMVEALLLGDRIAVMQDGQIIQIGTPRELLVQPANEYVEQLMRTPKNQAERVAKLLNTA
ncbi:MAG: ABC transporter ATP-binding protein [Acidobacteria bacterium]|nr:ABC transporter ATP-binding protein [Acidobacteriota bacterium]